MKKNVRLIARLDIKGRNLVKTIQLEGLRKLGDPNEFAQKYYEQGIDEILYMDIVASLYERENMLDIVRETTKNVFIPITVGGGIRSVEDVREVLLAGGDKVAINTAGINRPKLIREISQRFGSQCMVVSIEAKRTGNGQWEAYCDNGREKTGKDAVLWAKEAYEQGAGEILITSIDQEGTGRGFDIELVSAISSMVPIPVIASGGMGKLEHLERVVEDGGADAVAMANVLHYNKLSVEEIRKNALAHGMGVRRYG